MYDTEDESVFSLTNDSSIISNPQGRSVVPKTGEELLKKEWAYK